LMHHILVAQCTFFQSVFCGVIAFGQDRFGLICHVAYIDILLTKSNKLAMLS
jgi:hypothetical protein